MGLKEAKKVGLKRVMIDCSVCNVASNKTIKALGGLFERCEIDPNDNTKTNVYWINVDESLENYKSIYEQYVSKK
jgi:predicted acetyltransferase